MKKIMQITLLLSLLVISCTNAENQLARENKPNKFIKIDFLRTEDCLFINKQNYVSMILQITDDIDDGLPSLYGVGIDHNGAWYYIQRCSDESMIIATLPSSRLKTKVIDLITPKKTSKKDLGIDTQNYSSKIYLLNDKSHWIIPTSSKLHYEAKKNLDNIKTLFMNSNPFFLDSVSDEKSDSFDGV